MNWKNIKIVKFDDGYYAVRRGYFGIYSYKDRATNSRIWWGKDSAKDYAMSKNKKAIYELYTDSICPPKRNNHGIDVTKDFKLELAEDRLSGY